MRTAFPIMAIGLALQGCIIYDHDCPGCARDPYDDRPGDRPDRDDGDCEEPCTDDTGDVEEPPPVDYGFFLTPDEAEQGQVFIGSLRADGEDTVDLASITDLRLFGDVEVLASDLRSSELLLTLRVADDADLGMVDLLVELNDGSAAFQDGVLEIFPAGSGHEAGGSDDGSDPCE